MVTSAQLDNDKSTLSYQVELLKDRLEEMQEAHTQLQVGTVATVVPAGRGHGLSLLLASYKVDIHRHRREVFVSVCQPCVGCVLWTTDTTLTA